MCLNGVVSISTFPWNPVVDALILGEKKCKGFVRGYYPLLFDTLPEMPFWKDIVPFLAEPVENVCSNPLRLALNESDLKRKSKGMVCRSGPSPISMLVKHDEARDHAVRGPGRT